MRIKRYGKTMYWAVIDVDCMLVCLWSIAKEQKKS